MEPVVLSLDCPKVRAAMADITLTQRWEVLRRSADPLTTHELAEACGVSDGVAQQSLDLLVEAKLAARMRATAQRREITYRAISDRVIVQWDASSDAHLGFLLQNRQAMRAYSRSVIDRNDTAETRGMPGLPKFRGHQSFTLTHDEAQSIWQALRNAWELITQVEAQARERAAAAKHARGPRKHGAEATEQPDERGYHVALEFRPLKTPELPISDIGTWEKQALAKELAYLSRSPGTVLTQREQQIAKRLASGESRPEVAKALGVSPNTIASATKRIYAKLGVRSRAEFTSRMKGA
ncbi:MAG: LuxR C-terminal-related transcriptional regulator [bacterium]|jgi:DNA-binding CsgD family transcriptional regulator